MAPPPKAPSSNRPRSGGPRRPKSDGPSRDGERGGRTGGKSETSGKPRAGAKAGEQRPPRANADRSGAPRGGTKAGEQRPSRTGTGERPTTPRTKSRTAEQRPPRDASERSGGRSGTRGAARSAEQRPPREASERSDTRAGSRSGEQRAPRAAPDAPGRPRAPARADTSAKPRFAAQSDAPAKPRFTAQSDGSARPRFTGSADGPDGSRDTRRTEDPTRSRPVRTPRFGKPKAAPSVRSPDRPEGDRIAKMLARAGIASRREIERMIEEGRIALNGTVIETPATILKSLYGITVDGEPVKEAAPARLFLFHKPGGCLTAERDPAGRTTIYDRLPTDIDLPRLMPVGRLDYNTEGLLLLTNDGELKRLLELPSTGVERTYRARAFGEISQEQLEELVMGIEIDGMKYGRIDANLERRTGRNTWIEMTLTEGKNREVRRVLEHFGLEVSRLIRTAYGPFVLGDSHPGAIEEVRRHDLIVFRASLEKATAIKPEKKVEE